MVEQETNEIEQANEEPASIDANPNVSQVAAEKTTKDLEAEKAAKAQQELAERRQQYAVMISEFVEALPSLIGIETCKLNLRLTRDGVFIKEEFLRSVILAFQKWQATRSSASHNTSFVKAKKKLFFEDQVFQVYLIEGKQTLVGYLLAFDSQSKRKLGLPYLDSKTLSAHNFLHSRDPLFSTLNAVDLVMKPGTSEIEVKAGAEIFRFNLESVKHFHEQAVNSPIIIRRFRKIREAQRYALLALVKILKSSRAVQERRPLLVPVGTERYPEQAFRVFYDWVFVFDERSFLRTAYELKGRNFDTFLNQELQYLAKKRSKRLPTLRVFNFPGRDVADIRVGSASYKIGRKVLQTLEKFYPFYVNKHGKTSKRFSLADILEFFAREFQQAYIVAPREIMWMLKGGKIKARQYRYNKRWLFLVNDKRSVFNCVQVPGSYQENNVLVKKPIDVESSETTNVSGQAEEE